MRVKLRTLGQVGRGFRLPVPRRLLARAVGLTLGPVASGMLVSVVLAQTSPPPPSPEGGSAAAQQLDCGRDDATVLQFTQYPSEPDASAPSSATAALADYLSGADGGAADAYEPVASSDGAVQFVQSQADKDRATGLAVYFNGAWRIISFAACTSYIDEVGMK